MAAHRRRPRIPLPPPTVFARYAEARAGAEDAVEVNDWDRSACPACGGTHRATLFTFPPAAILNHVVAKARANGIRAVVVTLLAVPAPYWPKLLRAPAATHTDGYLRARRHQAVASDSDAGKPDHPASTTGIIPPAPNLQCVPLVYE